MCVDCLLAEDAPDPDRDYRYVETDMVFTADADDYWPRCEIAGVLAWSETDPYAVEITFQPGTPGQTVWVVGRELLAEGMSAAWAVGIGDVRIRPNLAYPGMREMILRSPSGRLDLMFDALEMTAFLCAVERQIGRATAEGGADAL